MKLHETLKDAGDIIQMLESRERSLQEIVEIAVMIQHITNSSVQTKNQSDMQEKIKEEVLRNMRKRLPKGIGDTLPTSLIPKIDDLLKKSKPN